MLAAALVLAAVAAHRYSVARIVPQAPGWIEQFARSRLHLDLEIHGALAPRIALVPGLVAHDVDFARPGEIGPGLRGHAASVRADLDLWRLLTGRGLGIARVSASDAELELAAAPEPVAIRRAQLTLDEPWRVGVEGSLRGRPFSLATRVAEGAPGILKLEKLSLALGESDLGGELALDRSGPRPRITGSLTSRRLASADLGAGEPAAKPQETEGAAAPSPLDLPLPLGWLASFAADLEVRIGRLELAGHAVDDLTGQLALDDGSLEVRVDQATVYGGALRGRGAARTMPKGFALSIDASAKQIELGRLFHAGPSGRLDLDVRLEGSGATLRKALTSSHGALHGALEQAHAADGRIDLFGKSPLGLALSVYDRDQGTTIHCAVARIEVRDGVGRTDALAVTDDVAVREHGSIDLARLHVDAVVKPRPRRAGIGLPTAPLRISGPLADLHVSTDLAGVGRELAPLALAVVNPMAIAVPFVHLGTPGNPCEAALASPDAQLPEDPGLLRRAGDAAQQGGQALGRLLHGAEGETGEGR